MSDMIAAMRDARIRFGEALRRLREARGLSQQDVAKRRGMTGKRSGDVIGRVERETPSPPTATTMSEIIDALEATPEDFVRALADAHEMRVEPRSRDKVILAVLRHAEMMERGGSEDVGALLVYWRDLERNS